MAALVELVSGDDPARWADLGFAVSGDGVVQIGAVGVRCDGAGGGLRGWVMAGDGPPALDGIATAWTAPDDPPSPVAHPNGASGFDHVVVFTDSRDRTSAALVGAGGDERRRMDPPVVGAPMAFVRFGSAIVEVAEGMGPVRLWGLVAIVDDVDALAKSLGELAGAPRDAVQPGRRIVTVQPAAGLETALAFMTPRVRP